MAKRLNARITDGLAEKVEFLRRRTKLSVTEILKESIQLYYERVRSQPAGTIEILNKSGFVGCADGDESLSETYKEDLARSLFHKT